MKRKIYLGLGFTSLVLAIWSAYRSVLFGWVALTQDNSFALLDFTKLGILASVAHLLIALILGLGCWWLFRRAKKVQIEAS